MNRSPSKQTGMTLIEVLVSILIFSFGLLGFVGMQARAIQYSVSAEGSNRAALLANEMASTIVLNAASPNAYALLAAAFTPWQNKVIAAMGPNSTAVISPISANQVLVQITWPTTSVRAGAANSINQYTTQVTLP